MEPLSSLASWCLYWSCRLLGYGREAGDVDGDGYVDAGVDDGWIVMNDDD